MGFPIRKSTDRSLFTGYPWLIASYYVLHRLLLPRHPPCTLSHLTIQLKNNLFWGACFTNLELLEPKTPTLAKTLPQNS